MSSAEVRRPRGTLVLRALWGSLLAAFAGLFVYTLRHEIDPVVHDRYTRDIRLSEALDAQLDGEVMLSRQSLVTHYDDIVHTVTNLETIHKRLADVPAFLAPADRQQISALVKDSSGLLAEKQESIESFKTENAVLRNSVRFFPVGTLELRDRLESERGSEHAARDVNELLCTVLRFNVQPSDVLEGRARQGIASLTNDSIPASDAEDVDIVLLHARTVLEKRAHVDSLTDGIVAVPSRAKIEALDAAYARSYQAALRAYEERRLTLFLLAIAVLGLGATDIILHLRKVARASKETSEKLATLNLALVREKEREKELSELKSRFVSMTSHEFRTPLAVILSSAELLEAYGERWSASKKADHFSRIKLAVRGMTDLLDGILVIGRAEMERLQCAPARLDLARYCRELADSMASTLTPKHTFVPEIDEDFGEAWVDEKLLNHILTNLLSNAVKYSPDGGEVRFEARRVGDVARFVVSDEGIGIGEKDRARVFESFHRGGNVGTIAGTGLGLAVVKRSVDAHGGTLDVESKEGKGTIFRVEIPIVEGPARPEREAVADEASSPA